MRKNTRERKEQRRKNADTRQAKRDARSDAEQVKLLQERGAEGCKEYLRLRNKLNVNDRITEAFDRKDEG